MSTSMALYTLIYRSQAAFPMSDEVLTEILTECRLNNIKKDITGILLYGYGFFIQLLEGDKQAVLGLFHDKISLDARHNKVKILKEGFTTHRLYASWAMAFRPYDPKALIGLEGYVDPDKTSVYGRNLLSPLKTMEAMEMLSMEVNSRTI